MLVSYRIACIALALGGAALVGCASAKKTGAVNFPSDDESASLGAAPPIEVVAVPVTQLERGDVVETVDAGLGRFLGSFVTEASLNEQGKFLGFKIVRVNDPDLFQGLGIGPGDVVTSINDRPIERPGEAYEAFVALRSAPSLEIAYLRGGHPMRLSLPIVGKVEEQSQRSPQKPPAAKAPPAKRTEVPSTEAPSADTPSVVVPSAE